jgi:hypothetical protein
MAKAFVVESVDYDCDGIGFGWHYFEGEHGTVEEAISFITVEQDRCLPMGVEQGCRVMTLTTFYCLMNSGECLWSDWDSDYFAESGYHGHFSARSGGW